MKPQPQISIPSPWQEGNIQILVPIYPHPILVDKCIEIALSNSPKPSEISFKHKGLHIYQI